MWCLLVLCLSLLQGIYAPDSLPDYDWDTVTSLDEYVNRPDANYNWEVLDMYRYNDSISMYIVNMTSHQYMPDDFVTCSIWWHIMGIAIPDERRNLDWGVLGIVGGSNQDPGDYPGEDDPTTVGFAQLANTMGIVGGYIMSVPNGPCYFSNDPTYRRRTEDRIIAWSWRSFIDWGYENPDVVLRNPMTKSAKHGLDTIHAVCAQEIEGCDIQQFFVVGASKRGWTAWSLGATDRRVKAIIPLVFDLLNAKDVMNAHFQAMDGAYSWALEDYYDENITHHLWSDDVGPLYDIEDMIRFRSRFAGMPKYLILGSTDEFFHFQDSNHWWDLMPEPKHLFLCPNGDHVMITCWDNILGSLTGFAINIMEDIPFPEITWSLHETENGESGHVLMHTTPPPQSIAGPDARCGVAYPGGYQVRGWSSPTIGQEKGHNRRDWRMVVGHPDQEVHGVLWECANNTVMISEEKFDPETQQEMVTFRFDADAVDGEWLGFFIESVYMSVEGYPMYFTTQGNIIPDTYPTEACDSDETCYGYLV